MLPFHGTVHVMCPTTLSAEPLHQVVSCCKCTCSSSVSQHLSLCVLLSCRFLVFFMQVGFLAYETGSGRAKNVRNILLKNLLDVMLAAIVWWAVGYAFAYGKSGKGVIG